MWPINEIEEACDHLDAHLHHSFDTCNCGRCNGQPVFYWKANEQLAVDLVRSRAGAVMH